jgi:hypothetical protein
MKRVLFIAFSLFAASTVMGQTAEPVKMVNQPAAPEILVFKEAQHDFGQIPQGKPVFYFFEIKNTGTVPLKLDNVTASCGCTTPEWNKEAIAPGATDKIKVGYNSASEGHFEKSITITYNSSQTKQIIIKGDVWKAPVGSAPSNQSVQFLKQQIQ